MRHHLSLIGMSVIFNVLDVVAQEAGSNIACLDECFNLSTTHFTTFACGSAADRPCLCRNEEFINEVYFCSRDACNGPEDQVRQQVAARDTLCAGLMTAPEETVQETEAISQASAEPSPTTEVEVVETTTSAISSETTQVSLSSTSITSEPTVTSETSASESSESLSISQTASAGLDGDHNSEEDPADGGLSQGAAAGIGVGVTAVVVAIAIVAMVLLLRSRKRKQQTGPSHDEISRPLPDPLGDRNHTSFDQGYAAEKRGGDSFEMTANRYEDMMPRTTPRAMV